MNIIKIAPLISLININTSEQCGILLHTNLLFALNCIKFHIGYRYQLLTCISGVDFLSLKYRFGIIYELLSLVHNSRIRLKVFINELTSLYSIVSLYKNANWWEREIWDLYGIYFNDHPDLRRILTDYGFEGFPMRKDFPIFGFVELRYNQNKKRIVLDPIELSQDFRFFNFETPW